MSNTIGPDELLKLVSNELRSVIRDQLVRNTMKTECSPHGFHSLAWKISRTLTFGTGSDQIFNIFIQSRPLVKAACECFHPTDPEMSFM